MRIQRTVEIDQEITEVFGFISDPDNDPTWCPNVHQSTQRRGSGPEVGAVYEQIHKPGPAKPTTLTVELLEISAPTHLRMTTTDELARFDVSYDLEELPDGVTRLTQTDHAHFRGFAKLLQPVMWLAINAGIKRQFQQLKALLETGDSHIRR